jgi:folate-binding protein YgfZ
VSAAEIRLARRGVVGVSGPEAATFLDGILSVNVSDVVADAPRPGALLAPQGKILCELWVHAAKDGGFRLDVPRDTVPELIKRLALLRLRAKVEIADHSASSAVLVAPVGGGRRIGGAEEGANDTAGYDAWRVADGRPEQGIDFGSGEMFPSDVNLDLLDGVDYAKGCFIGQEVVSRMKRRGIIRRRTLVMALEGQPPAPGAPITGGDVALGQALSSAAGKTLALVRLDRLAEADPAAIAVEGRAARIAFPAWFPPEARRAAGEAAA